jgi:O-acetyl-ADP-ribose deacetylase (regulator of RNase III)
MIHPDYKEYAEMLAPKLKHAQGNLLDLAEAGEFDIVVQGCNCFNTMGGGIAKEIRARYPYAAAMDAGTMRGDYSKLGNWTHSVELDDAGNDKFTIINAYTQYNMSTGQDVFEYEAFALILKKLVHKYPGKNIGFPYIGMGLAMGDSTCILALLEDFAKKIASTGGSATLVEFK